MWDSGINSTAGGGKFLSFWNSFVMILQSKTLIFNAKRRIQVPNPQNFRLRRTGLDTVVTVLPLIPAGGSGLQGKVPFGKKKGSFFQKGTCPVKKGKVPFCKKESFPYHSFDGKEPFL